MVRGKPFMLLLALAGCEERPPSQPASIPSATAAASAEAPAALRTGDQVVVFSDVTMNAAKVSEVKGDEVTVELFGGHEMTLPRSSVVVPGRGVETLTTGAVAFCVDSTGATALPCHVEAIEGDTMTVDRRMGGPTIATKDVAIVPAAFREKAKKYYEAHRKADAAQQAVLELTPHRPAGWSPSAGEVVVAREQPSGAACWLRGPIEEVDGARVVVAGSRTVTVPVAQVGPVEGARAPAAGGWVLVDAPKRRPRCDLVERKVDRVDGDVLHLEPLVGSPDEVKVADAVAVTSP